jgi:hypothetical protein
MKRVHLNEDQSAVDVIVVVILSPRFLYHNYGTKQTLLVSHSHLER